MALCHTRFTTPPGAWAQTPHATGGACKHTPHPPSATLPSQATPTAPFKRTPNSHTAPPRQRLPQLSSSLSLDHGCVEHGCPLTQHTVTTTGGAKHAAVARLRVRGPLLHPLSLSSAQAPPAPRGPTPCGRALLPRLASWRDRSSAPFGQTARPSGTPLPHPPPGPPRTPPESRPPHPQNIGVGTRGGGAPRRRLHARLVAVGGGAAARARGGGGARLGKEEMARGLSARVRRCMCFDAATLFSCCLPRRGRRGRPRRPPRSMRRRNRESPGVSKQGWYRSSLAISHSWPGPRPPERSRHSPRL